MIPFLPIILLLFFGITQIYIWHRSKIFWLYYCVLFAYTIFTQLAYILYPDKLKIVSHFQYYGEEIFVKYWFFVFLSFICIFLLFAFFYNKKYRLIHLVVKYKNHSKNFLYIFIILIYESTLLYFLIKHFKNLNYYNQHILKGNKLWFYLFSFNAIIFLSIIYKITTENKKKIKILYMLIFLVSFSIFIVTSIRSGQRIEFFMSLAGIIAFYLYLYKNKIHFKKKKLKKILISFLVIIIAISIFQGIRGTRGGGETLNNFINTIKNPKIYLSLLAPKKIVFQDWLAPSLTLATSMEKKIISPSMVFESNIKCSIPLISHKSLGSIISRIIDPNGSRGYGYYILTEGYNAMGFMGFLYIAFIFTAGIKILETFFTNTKDKYINAFMYGIMGIIIIGVVRAQSMKFIRSIYLYFLPGIILLQLTNIKFYLKK